MALMICPSCGKQVSEKAVMCVHCGHMLKEENSEIRCPECDAVISGEVEICPNCGCPLEASKQEVPQQVEVTNVKLAVDKKKKRLIVIFVVIVLLCAVGGVAYSVITKQIAKKEYENMIKEYQMNYEEIAHLMIRGAVEAESTAGLIHDVWSNTIYEKDSSKTDKYTKDSKGKFYDDFNTSLMYLMISDEYTTSEEYLKSNRDQVQELMKELTNPPEEYKEAYAALKNLYDAYTKMVNLAINPTGNLTSYTSNFNEADTETVNCMNSVELYIKD